MGSPRGDDRRCLNAILYVWITGCRWNDLPKNRQGPTALLRGHPFDRACRRHYDGHTQLREHLDAFLNVYNLAKRLKTLASLTFYQFICSCWQKEPERFKVNPRHLSSGLNT